MDPKILTAVIAAIVAIVSAAITIVGQFRLARFKAQLDQEKESQTKQEQARQVLARYRDPLAHAAYDLQAKLFNILRQRLLLVYFVNGNDSEREYTVQNTIYVIAQYLCWREIIRRGVQHLDLGEEDATRQLSELLERIQVMFLSDGFDRTFRIFRGEQRAIGERLVVIENGALGCMGYAEFVDRQEESFRRWFRKLEHDVDILSKELPACADRLVQLQHALIDLLDYLDPQCIRFQKKYRLKV
jgi:hypothetical protein